MLKTVSHYFEIVTRKKEKFSKVAGIRTTAFPFMLRCRGPAS